jgi:hypothetical protein
MTGARESRLAAGARLSGGAALLGLALGIAASIAPAAAEKVGVAAAVNPDAFSSLAGSPQSQLNIGKSIFFNERINTTGSGLVQVLLVDGSTFTVGPGSDLVIDKFVYDPKKGVGQISASFSKGVMRFVGGKISKNEGGVSIDTPAGALAVRGGMVQGNGKVWSFLYGENMTLKGNNGKTYTVYQPGYTLDLSGGTPNVRPTTSGDVNSIMASLTNGSTGGTGNPSTSQPSAPQKLVETVSLQDLVSDATATQINDEIIQQEQQGQTQPPPQTQPQLVPVNARVLSPPNSYTAYGSNFSNPGENGILGGDDDPNVNADDFVWTFGILNGRFKGTVSGLNDGDESESFQPAALDFPATLQCLNGVCPINLAENATITQGGQTSRFTGLAVFKGNFFAYDLVSASDQASGDHPERLLVFGGSGYSFPAPSGKIYSFTLTPDTLQSGAWGPFASLESSPVQLPEDATVLPAGTIISDAGNGFISPLVLLERDGGTEDLSHAVWIQTSFFVGSGENEGATFINVALGEWSAEGGITGARRGGSIVLGPNAQTYSFSGDIASLSGPDGSGTRHHFMGTDNPNIVIGFDSTGTHNIGRDNPLNPTDDDIEDQSGATYHVGIGSGPVQPVEQQTLVQLKGFAAGFAQHPQGSPDIVANFSPSDVTLNFDAATNTMTSSFKLKQVSASALGVLQAALNLSPQFNLGFGGNGRSAYLGDNTFAAIESNGGSSVSTRQSLFKPTYTDNSPEVQGFIVSADAIAANQVLFGANDNGTPKHQAFCANCDFIKWGAWGARVDYQQQNQQTATADVQLGWWIAGDVAEKNEIPTTNMSASYTGDAIGTVNNNGQQYAATGGMSMGWNFGSRSGTLAITDFDSRDFSFAMGASRQTPQNLSGVISFPSLLAGYVGAANGAFVGPVSGEPPRGVIGNFGVSNPQDHWQATGIFGGTRP